MAIKKEEEKKKCIELRKEGKSLRCIAREVGVAKSSVMRWVKGIQLTEEQRANTYKERYKFPKAKKKKEKQVGHEVWAETRRNVRKEMQEAGRQKFIKEGKEYAFGCALFWAEGSKDRNSTILVNSDEDMILFFAKFLRKYFNVKSDQITIKLQYYDNGDLTIEDIIKYWCDKLDVTPDNFYKPTLRNKYYTNNNVKYIYGIPTIQVNDTNITQQLYGSVKEMINCETDKWVF